MCIPNERLPKGCRVDDARTVCRSRCIVSRDPKSQIDTMGACTESRGIITRMAKCDIRGGRESNNTCKQGHLRVEGEVEIVVGTENSVGQKFPATAADTYPDSQISYQPDPPATSFPPDHTYKKDASNVHLHFPINLFPFSPFFKRQQYQQRPVHCNCRPDVLI